MSDTDFTVKLIGTGLSLDQRVSKELANRIVMLVLSEGHEGGDTGVDRERGRPVHAGSDRGSAKNPAFGKLSLREYINAHNAKKIPQQIAAIGLHYQTKTNADVFSREQLEKGFKEGKVPKPRNLPRDIATAIGRGWIAEADEDNQYYITATGESALAANFSKDAKDNAGNGRRRRKRGKKSQKRAAK